MDLINKLDPDNDGYISLSSLKYNIDYYILEESCKIVLKSKVKDLCNENIVEPAEDIQKISNTREKTRKPKNLFSFFIDILLGLRLRNEKSLKFFFADFSSSQSNYLN
jgi:hypothetical protein